MNIPATKTTLTESLRLRGFGQLEVTNSSKRAVAPLFPLPPGVARGDRK